VGPLTLGILLAWAGIAGAHAAVVSSFPASGAHLAQAPNQVSVVFDQPVKPDNGGLVVLASDGDQVAGASSHPSPDVLQASLPRSLGQGAFVANYTVTSVDGHVVSGGIVFLVGNAKPGQIAQLARRTSPEVGAIDKFGQFLIYAGVLTAGGLAFFLAFILTKGPERRLLRKACVGASLLGIAGMFIAVAAQVALAGGSWSAVSHWGAVRQILASKLGAQSVVQLAGLAACVWSLRLSRVMSSQFSAFYGMLVSAGAFVLFGHAIASRERWLSIPADVVHVVFAAMWIGGLVGIVVLLRSRIRTANRAGESAHAMGSGHDVQAEGHAQHASAVGRSGSATAVLVRTAMASNAAAERGNGRGANASEPSILASTVEVMGRFSTMAGVSVGVLLMAGVLLAIAEVGSVANLFGTAYGQILLVKVALVGLLIVMAAYNRLLLLPVLTKSATRSDRAQLRAGWRRLLATVRLEAIGVVAVLAVTSILANSTPSNGAPVPLRPVAFVETQPFQGGHITLRITPNQALVNDFVVQFTGSKGAPADLAESVSVYLTLAALNVGPIETDMVKMGVGRFVLNNTPDPPIIGIWQITLQIQVSAFDQPDVGYVDNVR
jgi:copper transport protein